MKQSKIRVWLVILVAVVLLVLMFKPTLAQSDFETATSTATTTLEVASSTPPETPKTAILGGVASSTSKASLRGLVAVVFADEPRMLAVIKCESEFRQFDKYGKPLVSDTSDVGVMQINQVHWKQAKSLKLDIFNSAEDNIVMGRIVYKAQGIQAWTCYD